MKPLKKWENMPSCTEDFLRKIKFSISNLVPNSDIILHGSRVRNEAHEHSDWDLVILVDGPVDKTTTLNIKDCLYDLELENNEIISSIVRTKQEWKSPKYLSLPFRIAVENEGIVL
ncbi:MAG: hypothetical protein CSA21_06520 [Deltaproteobacteria bacterium]|nr:MAG: hypothetical protein CSA21_06520 [Deltaproteobacteria bacterium]